MTAWTKERTIAWMQQASDKELEAMAEDIITLMGIRKYRHRNVSLPFMIMKVMILGDWEQAIGRKINTP